MFLHQLVGPLTESQQRRADDARDLYTTTADRRDYGAHLISIYASYWLNLELFDTDRALTDAIWVAAGTVR